MPVTAGGAAVPSPLQRKAASTAAIHASRSSRPATSRRVSSSVGATKVPLQAYFLCDTVESMNDSLESSSEQGGLAPWLLLIHQVPAKPDYLRVKIRRRLHRIGATALKSS